MGIMVIPGIIGLRDGLPFWAFSIMVVGYLTVSLICYRACRETIIFDDNTQTIYLQKHWTWDLPIELGSYRTFQKCKEHKGLRFHFTDDGDEVECRCKSGSVEDREKFAEEINEFWRARQRFNEWSKQKKVEMMIQCDPSPIHLVSSKSYDSDPFVDADPGTGNSEGNIRICDDRSKYEQTQSVRVWMGNTIKLPQYTDILIENGFDSLEMFVNLNVDDLKMMGIHKLGHQKKILVEVRKLEEEQSALALNHLMIPSISYSQSSPQQSVDESVESGPPQAFLEGM